MMRSKKVLRTVLSMSFKRKHGMGEFFETESDDEADEEVRQTDEAQHAALVMAANKTMDNSPSPKTCSIDLDAEEHMGMSLTATAEKDTTEEANDGEATEEATEELIEGEAIAEQDTTEEPIERDVRKPSRIGTSHIAAACMLGVIAGILHLSTK